MIPPQPSMNQESTYPRAPTTFSEGIVRPLWHPPQPPNRNGGWSPRDRTDIIRHVLFPPHVYHFIHDPILEVDRGTVLTCLDVLIASCSLVWVPWPSRAARALKRELHRHGARKISEFKTMQGNGNGPERLSRGERFGRNEKDTSWLEDMVV